MTEAPDRLTAGRGELHDARWAAARASFTEAGRSPEAQEGLSWAAWWLDDEPAVFAARKAAYRGFRERGDATAAARMAVWLAVDELDFHGAQAVAGGWLRRAHRLLDGSASSPEHGWLAFHEGYLAHVARETTAAMALATRSAQVGRRLGVADLEMLGLALEGATLVATTRVSAGMRRLDEATSLALEREPTIPIAAGWTFCLLAGACVATRDFERAAEWSDRIAEFAADHGSRYMLAFCRAEYGAIDLWRGRWPQAEALLEASVEDFAASRPAWVGGPLAGLAELRRRQGRAADAEPLLERAGASPAAQLCRARLVLDSGRARQAADLLERVLRRSPAERGLDRAPALELLVDARVALGELAEAAAALAELRSVARAIGTAPLGASADRAEGALAAAGGDHDSARRLLEDAGDAFERAGAPFEAAVTRLGLAESLIAAGRAEVAEEEASRARERLLALGAVVEAGRAERLLGAVRTVPLAQLTPREREVLRLVAGGLTNRQIAGRLVLSEHTVHRHVTNLLRKLGLTSRTAAAAHAARSGLLDGPEG